MRETKAPASALVVEPSEVRTVRGVGARVRRALLHPEPAGPATGGLDRVHDGLVSGWLACTACGSPPGLLPNLLLDGRPVAATVSGTPRGDVPGGQGFVLRFPATGSTAPRVGVQCPAHPDQGLEVQTRPDAWRIAALGAIETSSWPMVSGWVAILDPADGAPELAMGELECLPVRRTVARPDVQAYLGAAGVGGFQLDLGTMRGMVLGTPLRTALPDGTGLRLTAGDQILATAAIKDSPLGPDGWGCLAEAGGPKVSMNCQEQVNLRWRFLATEIDSDGDWRELLSRLGLEDHSAETEQWADSLTHCGYTQLEVACWLAIRATQRLAAYAVSPLPLSLNEVPLVDVGHLPDRVRAWRESVIGVNYERHDPVVPEPVPVLPPVVDKVLVAGLVHHRSGLGQNALNSLRALELAGIHGCAAPFFPAPGGWNPRLSAYSPATRTLADHAVLLHVPIDRVIPSLSAQPALLRTDRLIGYFMWETQAIPRQFHRALNLVDEIWTATGYVAAALQAVTDTPVHVTGHVVDTTEVARLDRADLGIAEDAFIVHYAFDANSTVARKNPAGAIDAFHRAFHRDPSAVFVLKVRNMQQVHSLARQGDPHARDLLVQLDSDPGICVIVGEHDYSYALGLIQLADCYLSLHRSEGYGYGIAEAMALGTPVIATGYSGSADLATCNTAWLVGYDEVDVAPGEYFYWQPGMTWAEPHTDFAATLLQRLRDRNSPKHDAARAHVARVASMQALSDHYRASLAPTRGRSKKDTPMR